MSSKLVEKPVWTYEDYCVLPQDYNRHEIVEGDHVVTPSPSTLHQQVLTEFALLLGNHIRSNQLGYLLLAPLDVLLAPTAVVQPDLVFIRSERRRIMSEANIQGPPDLVVEILSPSTAAIDRGGKMALYAKYAVPNYWILDVSRLELELYELENRKYRLAGQFGKDGRATSPLFPGLVIELGQLGE